MGSNVWISTGMGWLVCAYVCAVCAVCVEPQQLTYIHTLAYVSSLASRRRTKRHSRATT